MKKPQKKCTPIYTLKAKYPPFSFSNLFLLFFLSSYPSEAMLSPEEIEANEAKLTNKTEETDTLLQVANGYYDARLITFNTHFFVRNEHHYQLHAQSSDETEATLYKQYPSLYEQATNSQLLITEGEVSLGVSVSTSITTTVKRPKGTGSTFVQYDKNHVIQQGKDFPVDATNEKNKVN